MVKICIICGREFEPRNWRQMLCSAECQHRHHVEWDHAHYLKQKEAQRKQKRCCIVCGREFTPPTRHITGKGAKSILTGARVEHDCWIVWSGWKKRTATLRTARFATQLNLGMLGENDMTDEQKRKVKANLKHIDVAKRALNCVDVDCLHEDTADGDEYASDLFVRWESVQYGLDDLRDYFTIKLNDADDTD